MKMIKDIALMCAFMFLAQNIICAENEPKVFTPPNIPGGLAVKAGEQISLCWWNIRWFPGGHPQKATEEDRQKQKADVAKIMNEMAPTISFHSEILNMDVLQKLNLGYTSYACTQIPRTENEGPDLPNQGLAMMSKLPWKEIWALDFTVLPDTPDRPSRGMIAALFEIPDLGNVTIYGTHFKSNRGGIDASMLRRMKTVDYIQWDFKRRGLDPAKDFIVISGDFNTSFHNPSFSKDKTLEKIKALGFVSAAEGIPAKEAVTIHASKRYVANDFDHIFVSKALAEKYKTPPPWLTIKQTPETVSDHFPLLLKIP